MSRRKQKIEFMKNSYIWLNNREATALKSIYKAVTYLYSKGEMNWTCNRLYKTSYDMLDNINLGIVNIRRMVYCLLGSKPRMFMIRQKGNARILYPTHELKNFLNLKEKEVKLNSSERIS